METLDECIREDVNFDEENGGGAYGADAYRIDLARDDRRLRAVAHRAKTR
jgi:hypothetical protein